MTETAKGKNGKTFGFAVDIVEPSVFSAALTTSSVRNPQGATELRAACDLLLPMLPNPRFKINLGFPLSAFSFHLPK